MSELHSTNAPIRPETDAEVALAKAPVLKALAVSERNALVQYAELREFKPGETLVTEGEKPTHIYLIVDGEVELIKSFSGRESAFAFRGRYEIVPKAAIIEDYLTSATVRAHTRTATFQFPRDNFVEILRGNAEASFMMLQTALERLETADSFLVRHQSASELGLLAAGHAHDLNNSVAALMRAVRELRPAIDDREQLSARIGSLALAKSEADHIKSLRADQANPRQRAEVSDPLELADRESDVVRWLDAHGTSESWAIAPTFVEAGWDVQRLETLRTQISRENLPLVLAWAAAGMATGQALNSVQFSARSIASLTTAMRTYARSEELPSVSTDIQQGLQQALLLTRHKLGSVTVVQEPASNLSPISAVPNELVQIWTNLISNAIDATDRNGTVTIRTHLTDDWIQVDIEDDGPGIPPDVQSRLFEPFFTTKSGDQGTGLGLSICNSIVKRHGGTIDVESTPGLTVFRVLLPLSTSGQG